MTTLPGKVKTPTPNVRAAQRGMEANLAIFSNYWQRGNFRPRMSSGWNPSIWSPFWNFIHTLETGRWQLWKWLHKVPLSIARWVMLLSHIHTRRQQTFRNTHWQLDFINAIGLLSFCAISAGLCVIIIGFSLLSNVLFDWWRFSSQRFVSVKTRVGSWLASKWSARDIKLHSYSADQLGCTIGLPVEPIDCEKLLGSDIQASKESPRCLWSIYGCTETRFFGLFSARAETHSVTNCNCWISKRTSLYQWCCWQRGEKAHPRHRTLRFL